MLKHLLSMTLRMIKLNSRLHILRHVLRAGTALWLLALAVDILLPIRAGTAAGSASRLASAHLDAAVASAVFCMSYWATGRTLLAPWLFDWLYVYLKLGVSLTMSEAKALDFMFEVPIVRAWHRLDPLQRVAATHRKQMLLLYANQLAVRNEIAPPFATVQRPERANSTSMPVPLSFTGKLAEVPKTVPMSAPVRKTEPKPKRKPERVPQRPLQTTES